MRASPVGLRQCDRIRIAGCQSGHIPGQSIRRSRARQGLEEHREGSCAPKGVSDLLRSDLFFTSGCFGRAPIQETYQAATTDHAQAWGVLELDRLFEPEAVTAWP